MYSPKTKKNSLFYYNFSNLNLDKAIAIAILALNKVNIRSMHNFCPPAPFIAPSDTMKSRE